MSLDVIANRGRFNLPALKAERAERLDHELPMARFLPSREIVPFSPRPIVTPTKVRFPVALFPL